MRNGSFHDQMPYPFFFRIFPYLLASPCHIPGLSQPLLLSFFPFVFKTWNRFTFPISNVSPVLKTQDLFRIFDCDGLCVDLFRTLKRINAYDSIQEHSEGSERRNSTHTILLYSQRFLLNRFRFRI
jgi:hypothetical protein